MKPKFLALLLSGLMISACQAQPVPVIPQEEEPETQVQESEVQVEELTLIERSDQLLTSIQEADFDALAMALSEEGELLLSWDSSLTAEDPNLSQQEIRTALSNEGGPYVWGVAPSGENVEMPLENFLRRYVQEPNFLNRGQKESFEGTSPERPGSSLDNTEDFFEGETVVVEYYIAPSTEDGLDWQNLRFVYLKTADGYDLVALTRDNWAP